VDIYLLKSGTYSGNITIDKKITIIGEDGAKIVGAKKGSVITINANHVTIKNLIISNSGINLASQDSAIFVNKNKELLLGGFVCLLTNKINKIYNSSKQKTSI
jgi:nitrous oxidase accessory protein